MTSRRRESAAPAEDGGVSRASEATGEPDFKAVEQAPASADVDASPDAVERAAVEAPVEGDPLATGDVEQDLEELVARAAERDEYLALAQRTQADFENYRKRIGRDLAAAEARGVARLAKELLPALDNLSLALKAGAADAENGGTLAEGIRLVYADLLAALARVGVKPFSPEGEPFDPERHEAMAQQPFEGVESGTVAEVYQQGYLIDGAVLRPARVVVAG
ncbi:MAG TPA: nucleotide exchange factor GrpE [Solirubrobacteraceae bacterium]|nr:nucleotide exchange factor GrpE [Solirubrobacteraceae bacterium]